MDYLIGGESITVIGVLIVVITTGAKGIWAFTSQTNKEIAAKDAFIAELTADRDSWRRMALRESMHDISE